MRLTTKGRFAVTAMVDLSMRQTRGPVTLAAISERQHISLSYLEQLFGKLRRAKLVNSVRGPGGGYNLAKPTTGITVAEIIAAVDEPMDATQCGGKENCIDDRRCITHDLWATLNEKMNDYLSSVSLADVVAHQQGKPVSVIRHFRQGEVPGTAAAVAPTAANPAPSAEHKVAA
jgi:Rrf2 family iron-sulfur cluster assembly transcriptional regulator